MIEIDSIGKGMQTTCLCYRCECEGKMRKGCNEPVS